MHLLPRKRKHALRKTNNGLHIRITGRDFVEILSRTSAGREFLKHHKLGTIDEKKELDMRYRKKS